MSKLSAASLQLIFGPRLLAAIACLILPSVAALAQSGGERAETSPRYPFRPRRPAIKTNNSRETINTIKKELARLREQAPEVMPRKVNTAELSRLAHQIAESSDSLQDLTLYKPEGLVAMAFERLTLPAKQLSYRECYAAAALHEELFLLVRDDRKGDFGAKAVQYLKQYMRLANVRQEVWTKLKAEGIPVDSNRAAPFGQVDGRGDGLTIFEYHNGYYCGHLWFRGGHQYTSFVVDQEGNLEYATLDFAARIVGDALGQPLTTNRAVRFLREVLRVLPYKSKVVWSVQDIPAPAWDMLFDEDVTRGKAAWEKFFKGTGQSITRPTRKEVGGNAEYTIYVYQRLGGQVIRYRVRCSRVGHVAIQQETIARWVGGCWGIK